MMRAVIRGGVQAAGAFATAVLVALVVPGDAGAKVIKVPGAAPSITEAYAMAAAGDTISLAPGIYSRKSTDETFPIFIQKPVVILGTADSTQVIIAPDAMKSAVNYTEIACFIVRNIEGQRPAVFSHVTFRKGGMKKGVGLDIYNCHAVVEGCVFSGIDTGVRIGGDCDARVSGCLLDGVEIALSAAKGHVLFENNTIRHAKKGVMMDWSTGTVTHNRIIAPTVDGIVLNRSDDVKILANHVEGASQCGISLRGSSPLVADNELVGNNYSIWCTDKSAAEIKRNEVRGSRGYDLGIERGATPIVGGSLADANYFYGDGKYLVNNLTEYPIEARYNYWGSDCPKADRFTGQVHFSPWADKDRQKELSRCP